VGVVLSRLVDRANFTLPLFEAVSETVAACDSEKHRRLDATLDKLRSRYGRHAVYFGSVQENRDSAPMRISFTHIPDLASESD
jgi:DNA polymerase-4